MIDITDATVILRTALIRAHTTGTEICAALIEEFHCCAIALIPDAEQRKCFIIGYLLEIFAEDVGVMQIWTTIIREFAGFMRAQSANELEFLLKILHLFAYTPSWIPINHAIRIFAGTLPHISEEFVIEIHVNHGNYLAILDVDDHSIDTIINYVQCDAPRIGKLFESIGAWKYFVRWHAIERLITLLALRIFDPCAPPNFARFLETMPSTRVEIAAGKIIIAQILKPQSKYDTGLKCALSTLLCSLDAAIVANLRTFVPGVIMNSVLDGARQSTSPVSVLDEIIIDDMVSRSPLITTVEGYVQDKSRTLSIMTKLHDDYYIGRDDQHYVIAGGPFDEKGLVLRANINNLRNVLMVSHDGQFSRIALQKFFVFNIVAGIIPDKILPPARIMSRLSGNIRARRMYVVNCLWRFIMNFSGSSSTNILVVNHGDDAHVYCYDECAIIGGSLPKRIHQSIVNECVEDVQFYYATLRNWSIVLRTIAGMEGAICAKYPKRALQTGINHIALQECSTRANNIVSDLINLLKKTDDKI